MPILGVAASGISGHLWAPGQDYVSISTATVTSGGQATITFSSIPTTFTHLQIRCLANTDTSTQDLLMRFNGDTAANYTTHMLYGQGASTTTYNETAQTSLRVGNAAGSTTISNSYAASVIDIYDYLSTTKNKTFKALIGFDSNSTANVNYGGIFFQSGLWFKTPEAINSISLTVSAGLLKQYSQLSLYGVK